MFFKIYFSRRKFEQDAAALVQKQNGWAAGAYCGARILSASPDEHLASPLDEYEMADCYIAAAGIYNFNQYIAMMILNYLSSYGGALPHEIEKAASEKMHKNETERVWIVVNGVIRHVKFCSLRYTP